MEGNQCNQPSARLLADHAGEWCHTRGTQCWCLLLAGWALSSGQSQVGLEEEKFMLCTTSILATMAILFLSQLGDKVKESESHGTGHLIHLAIKTPLSRSPFSDHSHETQISSTWFAHSERSVHICLPKMSLSPVLQSCFF